MASLSSVGRFGEVVSSHFSNAALYTAVARILPHMGPTAAEFKHKREMLGAFDSHRRQRKVTATTYARGANNH
jgi:hypothetical protein